MVMRIALLISLASAASGTDPAETAVHASKSNLTEASGRLTAKVSRAHDAKSASQSNRTQTSAVGTKPANASSQATATHLVKTSAVSIPHAFPVKKAVKIVPHPRSESLPHFLAGGKATNDAQCTCEFSGVCEPDDAMSFMKCMRSHCDDPRCKCEDDQYINACRKLNDSCAGTSLVVHCMADKTEVSLQRVPVEASTRAPVPTVVVAASTVSSTTTTRSVKEMYWANAAPAAAHQQVAYQPVEVAKKEEELRKAQEAAAARMATTTTTTTVDPVELLYHNLEELKEESCRLQLAMSHGALNADNTQHLLKSRIEQHMMQLEKQCLDIPEMHCEKDFREYEAPPPPCNTRSPNSFTRRANAYQTPLKHKEDHSGSQAMQASFLPIALFCAVRL